MATSIFGALLESGVVSGELDGAERVAGRRPFWNSIIAKGSNKISGRWAIWTRRVVWYCLLADAYDMTGRGRQTRRFSLGG